MKMKDEFCLILCTCPDMDVAQSLATRLIGDHLAACVNVLPGVRSVYVWDGKIENAQEVQLFIKTQPQCYEAISYFMKAHHPYEVPELLMVPINGGDEGYLAWVKDWIGVSHQPQAGGSSL